MLLWMQLAMLKPCCYIKPAGSSHAATSTPHAMLLWVQLAMHHWPVLMCTGMELDWATLRKQLMKLDPSQPVTVVTAEVAAKKAAEIIALEAEARLHGGKTGQSRSTQQQQLQRNMPPAAAAPPVAPAKAQAAKSSGVQTAQPAGRQVAQEANKTAAQPGSGAPALAAVSKPCDTRPVSAAATAAA
ncbi:hypothetical protein QJQ45_000416 [Haematococcus lacustris]|nr:hypothetical protein QJQ45_000416 [Haematococcus lacustris]